MTTRCAGTARRCFCEVDRQFPVAVGHGVPDQHFVLTGVRFVARAAVSTPLGFIDVQKVQVDITIAEPG